MFRKGPGTAGQQELTRQVQAAQADVGVVTDVVRVVERVRGGDAVREVLEVLRSRLGCDVASYWKLDGSGALTLALETPAARQQAGGTALVEGTGPTGGGGRDVVVTDLSTAAGGPRAASAHQSGLRTAVYVPLLREDHVVGALELLGTDLTVGPSRSDVLRSIGALLVSALARGDELVRQEKAAQDVEAVSTLIRELSAITSRERALQVALETIRRDFDWQYGSFWRLDEEAQVLRFVQESGDAGAEFKQVTLSASFAKGVGLSGRAWERGDLVFVEDLGQLKDCVRRPAAQRAGVKSGVCLPIVVDGHLIGTMDFFATRTLIMYSGRESALRNTAFLVGQALSRFAAAEQLQRAGNALTTSIGDVERNVTSATDVALRGERRAEEADEQVAALGQASREINDVVSAIQSIAAQTKLLALNATIEAARAGEAGKGFAVVAEEVKELSGETERATANVSTKVATIQQRVDAVTESLGEIHSVVAEINTTQTHIAGVLAQQLDVTRTILG